MNKWLPLVLSFALAFYRMQVGDSGSDTAQISDIRWKQEPGKRSAQATRNENPHETEYSQWSGGSQQPSSEMEEDDYTMNGQETVGNFAAEEEARGGAEAGDTAGPEARFELSSDEWESRTSSEFH